MRESFYIPEPNLEQDPKRYKWVVSNGEPEPDERCSECREEFTDEDLAEGNWESVEYYDPDFEDEERSRPQWVTAYQHVECKRREIEENKKAA